MFACIYCIDQPDGLARIANQFSPWVEIVSPGTVVFPVDGLRKLIGGPHQIASSIGKALFDAKLRRPPGIAIAPTPDTAILAARHLPGVTILAPGETSALGELPIESLPVGDELYDTLSRWGIRSLGDLARLPETGIAERLGAEALRWRALALGRIDRPLKPLAEPTRYERRTELDHPLDQLEPILFLLSRFLNELCDELKAQSLAAGVLLVTLEIEKLPSSSVKPVPLSNQPHVRTLRLPFPTRDVKFLLKLLQHDLEAHPPTRAITAVGLKIDCSAPRLLQGGLFVPQSPEPEKLELTLGKIRGLVGQEKAGTPELLDTWRPEGWRLTSSDHAAPKRDRKTALETGLTTKLAFRMFRPPRKVRVLVEAGMPRRVNSERVLEVAGPWRTSGDWWGEMMWDRDEWDVALSDLALYRLFLDRRTSSDDWFLEGSYD
ncbi:MAG: hypothetical protein ABI823_04950 [Bryobacteraceae bacterium]